MDGKALAGNDGTDATAAVNSASSGTWSQLQSELIRNAVASKDWSLLEKYRQISEEMAKSHRSSVNDVRSNDIPECPRSLVTENNSNLPLDVDYTLYPERAPGFWKDKSVKSLGHLLMRLFYAEAYSAFFVYLFRDNNRNKRRLLPVNNTYIRISLWEASSLVAPLEKVLQEIGKVNLAHFERIPFLEGDTSTRADMKSEAFFDSKYSITSAGRTVQVRVYIGDTGYGFALRSVVPTTVLVGGKVWLGPIVHLRLGELKSFVTTIKEYISEVEHHELTESDTTAFNTQPSSPVAITDADDGPYNGFSLTDLSWPTV